MNPRWMPPTGPTVWLYRVAAALLMALAVVLPLLVGSGCARVAAPAPHDWSGFLDDYSRLRLGETGDLPFVYRNPKARWTEYDHVLFEPVTLWRSGRDSLAPIPEDDLLRLVARFEGAVRTRLGAGIFGPNPGGESVENAEGDRR